MAYDKLLHFTEVYVELPDFVTRPIAATSAMAPTAPHGANSRYDKDSIIEAALRSPKDTFDYIFAQDGKRVGASLTYLCKFHEEKTRSLTVDPSTGGWRCHACQASGDVISAWQRVFGSSGFVAVMREMSEWCGNNTISIPRSEIVKKKKEKDVVGSPGVQDDVVQLVKEAAIRLMDRSGEDAMNRLRERYGISAQTAARYQLGWHQSRLWIPVTDGERIVNVRKHDIMRRHCAFLDRADGKTSIHPDKVLDVDSPHVKPSWDSDIARTVGRHGAKVMGIRGHNGLAAFPHESIQKAIEEKSKIILTGGELKALLFIQMGFNAFCFTGGEGAYSRQVIEHLCISGVEIEIVMDNDPAGIRASEKLAEDIMSIGVRGLTVVTLPKKDVNDYYRERGWDFSDWLTLPRKVIIAARGKQPEKLVKITELHEVRNYDKDLTFRAILAGTGDAPSFIASSVKATCFSSSRGKLDICGRCSLPGRKFSISKKLDEKQLVELAQTPPKKQEEYLRKNVSGVPSDCDAPEFDFERTRVHTVGLTQDVDSLSSDIDDTERGSFRIYSGFYVGPENINENEPHVCTGKVFGNPKDSSATVALRRMVSVRRSFEDVDSSVVRGGVAGMPGGNGSLADIVDRHAFICNEYAEKILGIYGQEYLISGALLLSFMPIRFTMFGRPNEKIGADALAIGDSRAGKSTTMKGMFRHIKAGRFIACEGATYAGLVGGADMVGSRKFFAWGAIPTQDMGMVALDEVDGIIEKGIFSQLTSIRSDGVATREIAGGKRSCPARVRSMMMCNPSGNKPMKYYQSAMHAVQELIAAPQDIARFEYAIPVVRDDNPDTYNRRPSSDPIIYTSDIASMHVRWAWQQAPRLADDVSDACMSSSTDLSRKYRGLHLLPPSESRWKIARIASSIAAMCGSHDDDGIVLVNRHHVDFASVWLDALYSSEQFRVDRFVGKTIENRVAVVDYIKRLGPHVVEYMIRQDAFTRLSIEPLVAGQGSSYNEFVNILHVKNSCLTKRGEFYWKSPQFVDILEELLAEAKK